MNIQALAKLKQVLQLLDEAEQLCPKPVLSTQLGREIAAASSHAVAAYKIAHA